MTGIINKQKFNISVLGLWHLGEIYSVGLAELGQQVFGIDNDAAVIEKLKKGEAPVAEPDLSPMILKNISSGNLIYTNDFSKIGNSEIVWFTYDTPVGENGEPQLDDIFSKLKMIIPALQENVLLIFSSQLVVGTSDKIHEFIKKIRPNLNFYLAYAPENLQLGQALKSFFEPGRIVIGADNQSIFPVIRQIFQPLNTEFLEMNLASAEVAKHAINSFLATSLSFIYDIADICEKTGANVADVAVALRTDKRIGPGAYLDASIGFSGGTLVRDLKALIHKAKEKSISLPVIESVWLKNNTRPAMVAKILEEELGDLRGKNIGLLGITYKVGTPVLRHSLPLSVAKILEERGASVRASDPDVNPAEVSQADQNIKIFSGELEMAEGCQAVVLLKSCDEFKNINLEKLSRRMRPPRLFFDTRNFLTEKENNFVSSGFKYRGLGRS